MEENINNIIDLLQSIKIVKFELNAARENKEPKHVQMEIFGRLINLYSSLNIQQLQSVIKKKAA